jgi:hypothetical protein
MKRQVCCKMVAVADEDRSTKCCVCGRISLSREEEGGVFICERTGEAELLRIRHFLPNLILRLFRVRLCGLSLRFVAVGSGSKAELALTRKSIEERGMTNNGSGGSILA